MADSKSIETFFYNPLYLDINTQIFHCTSEQLKKAKKYPMDFEGTMRMPHLELRKETPLDGLEKPLPNPLMASLLQRLAIKGFWVWLLQTIKWGLISKL